LRRSRQRVQDGSSQRPSYSYYGAEKTSQTKQGRRDGTLLPKRGGWKSRARLIPTLLATTAILIAIVFSTTLTTTPKVHFAGAQSPYRSVADYQSAIAHYMTDSLL